MIKIGGLRLEGRAEDALYVLCAGAALYFLGNGLSPELLHRDPFIQVPIWIHGPLLMLGALTSGVIVFLFALLVWTIFPSTFATEDSYVMRSLLDLAAEDPELVAPNLSSSERSVVLETARTQLAAGDATAIHAAITPDDGSAEFVVVEGPRPHQLCDVWDELSDGAAIRSPRVLKRSYGIEVGARAVEVVWD